MMRRSMIIGRVNQILIRSDIDFFGSPWYNLYCTGASTNKNLKGCLFVVIFYYYVSGCSSVYGIGYCNLQG